MQDFKTLFNELLKAIKNDVNEEFLNNFTNKSFFGDKWADSKNPNKKTGTLMQTGALRRGQQARIEGDSIVFYNTQPYASIQNEGASIIVTAKMKTFFWAMYYKASNKVTYSVKTRAPRGTAKNEQLNMEAAYWKSLALMKVGKKLVIPPRRWMGEHQKVHEIINRHVSEKMNQIEQDVKTLFNKK